MNGIGITPVYGDITPDLFDGGNLLLISFTPEELNVGDFGRHRANTLISSCAQAGAKASGVVSISYAYDNDPREIYEIPKVVSHARYIAAKCPHILYYIAPSIEILRPFILCQCDLVVVGRNSGMAKIGIKNINAARKTVRTLLDAAVAYAKSMNDTAAALNLQREVMKIGLL